MELQAQGSAGLNHGRPPRHPGGCVRAGAGAGRPAAFRASARRFPASAAASSGGRRRGRAGSAAPGCPGRPPGAVAPTARGCPDIADAGVQRYFGGGVGIDRRFEAGGQGPALLGAQFQVGRAFLGAAVSGAAAPVDVPAPPPAGQARQVVGAGGGHGVRRPLRRGTKRSPRRSKSSTRVPSTWRRASSSRRPSGTVPRSSPMTSAEARLASSASRRSSSRCG